MAKVNKALFWSLFAAGGTLTAFVFPVLALITLLAAYGNPPDIMAFDQMHEPEHGGAPELGCPLNNLAQEMSNIDEGFRQRLETIVAQWRSILSQALRRGQSEGTVRTDLDADATAVRNQRVIRALATDEVG